MPLSIVSNTSSLIAHSALTSSNERLGTAMTKLSSGERVFSAEEDAAALGVGTGMSIEIAALGSAAINTSTASSMLQIAEGALGEMTDILQRMSTLASQASSGQYSDEQRAMVDSEFQALKEELDRIASDTEFSGIDLLSGDALYDVTYGSAIQADGIRSPEFNSATVSADATFRYTYDSSTESLTMTQVDGGVSSSQTIDLTVLLDDLAGVGQNLSAGEEITVNFSGVGMSLTLDDAFDRTADILGTTVDNSGADVTFTWPAPVAPTLVSEPITFPSTGVTNEAVDALIAADGADYSVASGLLDIAVQTDGASITLGGASGFRFAVDGGPVGADGADSTALTTGGPGTVDIYVTTASGYEKLATMNYDDLSTTGATDGSLSIPVGKGLISESYSATGGAIDLTFMVGSSATSEDLLTISIPPATVSAIGLTTISTTTMSNAEAAVVAIENAFDTINTMRSDVGASQSRLEFVGVQLSSSIENTTNAKSALLDTDVPQEISNMATEQALVEVGISMLTQVNQMPQQILRLLE